MDASSAPVAGFRRWIVPSPLSASLTISVPPSGLPPMSEVSALVSGIVSSAATVAGDTRTSSSDSVQPDRAAPKAMWPCAAPLFTGAIVSSPVTMSVRGSSRSSMAWPENEPVSHSDPAAARGAPIAPGLNVFVATIAPVAASTRASSVHGGSCPAGDSDRRKYRPPPVTVSAGSVNIRPTMPPAGMPRDAAPGERWGSPLEARVLAGCCGRGVAQPVPTATSASTAAAAAHAAGNVLMPFRPRRHALGCLQPLPAALGITRSGWRAQAAEMVSEAWPTQESEKDGIVTKAPSANRGGRYGLLLLVLIGTYLLAAFTGAKLATELQVLLFAFVLLIALRNSPMPAPWPLIIGAVTVIGTAVTFWASLTGSRNGKAAEDLWKALILLMAAIMLCAGCWPSARSRSRAFTAP